MRVEELLICLEDQDQAVVIDLDNKRKYLGSQANMPKNVLASEVINLELITAPAGPKVGVVCEVSR